MQSPCLDARYRVLRQPARCQWPAVLCARCRRTLDPPSRNFHGYAVESKGAARRLATSKIPRPTADGRTAQRRCGRARASSATDDSRGHSGRALLHRTRTTASVSATDTRTSPTRTACPRAGPPAHAGGAARVWRAAECAGLPSSWAANSASASGAISWDAMEACFWRDRGSGLGPPSTRAGTQRSRQHHECHSDRHGDGGDQGVALASGGTAASETF